MTIIKKNADKLLIYYHVLHNGNERVKVQTIKLLQFYHF